MADQSSINYKVLVAIYTKFQQVFGDNSKSNKFLSFPCFSRHSFDPDQLDSLASNRNSDVDDLREADRSQAEFSKLVNLTPRGIIFDNKIDDNYFLWDAYNDFIHSAVVAESTYTDEDKKSFEEVRHYLFEGDEFSVTETVAYKKYKEYRDLCFSAEETRNDKLTNYKLRNDEESKKELDLAQKRLDAVEEEWKTIGNKEQVEYYLDKYEQLSRTSPALLLQGEKQFNLDTALLTCVSDKSRYAPSYLFPANLSKKTDWIKISLTKEDIEQLVKQAPNELLKGMEAELNKNSNITRVTFECRSARIDRPWFKKEAITSRYWKFPNTYNQSLFSYGTDKLEEDEGSFPAYIASVVFTRNIEVEEKINNVLQKRRPRLDEINLSRQRALVESNRRSIINRRNVLGDSAQARIQIQQAQEPQVSGNNNQVIEDDSISIMAYICCRFGLCPNPAPDATWPDGRKDYLLTFKQSGGGKVHATVNGKRVEQGSFTKGQSIVLTAVPDQGYLLKLWIVNDQQIEAKGNEYSIEMPEGGLKVTAVWHEGRTVDSSTIELSPDGKVLVNWDLSDSEVNMNEYSNLTGITTIAGGAFNGCVNLRKIRIGDGVTTIASRAFSKCKQLSIVELPESVLEIADGAFDFKNNDGGPTFIVDDSNKRYTAVDGVLVERKRIGRVKGFNCEYCSFTAFAPLDGTKEPSICPYCGQRLVPADEKTIIMPEGYLPFKLSEAAAKEAVMVHYRKKKFVKKEFLETADKKMILRRLYLPVWEYDVTSDTDYTAITKKTRTERVTNADGTTTNKQYIDEETKTGHVSDDHKDILLTASKLYSTQALSVLNVPRQQPDNDLWNTGIPLEQYTITPREGVKSILEKVNSDVLDSVHRHAKIGLDPVDFEVNTTYTKLNYRLVMRPVWVGGVEFEGKNYPVFINGYRGDIDNSTKLSLAIDTKKRNKTYAMITGIIVLISLILYLLFSQAYKKSTDTHTTSGVNTEHVVKPSGSSSGSSSGTVTRPSVNVNNVNRPTKTNTVNRPNSTTSTRPLNGYSNSSRRPNTNTVTNKVKEDNNNNSGTTRGRRGGKRLR